MSKGTLSVKAVNMEYMKLIQVAQLSQRDRAAAWVSCGANINVVLRIHTTLL